MELQPVLRARARWFTMTAGALCAVVVAVAMGLLVALAMGLQFRVVGTDPGSSADRGTVLVTRPASAAELTAGDEVSFVAPAPYGSLGEISRRVDSVGDGVLTTMSSETVQDPWAMSTVDPDIKIVVARVPWLGCVWLGYRWLAGWMGVFGLLALVATVVLVPVFAARFQRRSRVVEHGPGGSGPVEPPTVVAVPPQT